MIEYSVMLRRYPGSARPDVVVYRDEDREKAIAEMKRYRDRNGFTVEDRDGRFAIYDIVLVEQEPIVGAPIISETPYLELFDESGRRRPGNGKKTEQPGEISGTDRAEDHSGSDESEDRARI